MTVSPKTKANLRNIKDLSPEERREFASKGGKASAQIAKQKKSMREALNALLDCKPAKEELEEIKKKYPGMDVTNLTYRGLVGLAMLGKAVGLDKFIKADVAAAQFVRDTSGEKPVDVHKMEEPAVVQKVFVSPEAKAAVDRHIEETLRDGN